MLLAIVLLLAAPPPPPTDSELYSAIWNDLQLNAMIGNHNEAVTWEWFFGHDNEWPPTLRIIDLACKGGGRARRCSFDLSRTVHPEATDPGEAKEESLLACVARFRLETDRGKLSWGVVHTPGEGHTRTTLQCKAKRSGA